MSDQEQPDLHIDSPLSSLPDLSLYGIESSDLGICVDSLENRKILRSYKMSWMPVYDSNGDLTDNIQAFTKEMIEAKNRLALEDKRPILKDSRDLDSDYVTGLDLVLTSEAEDVVPAWVLAAARHWVQVERRREETGKEWRPALAGPPGRCRFNKIDGTRCQMWHGGRKGEDGFCRIHLGQLKKQSHSIEKARARINASAEGAVDVLEELLSATSEPMRLKAATEFLDRAGIRGGVEIDQKVTISTVSSADMIAQRLAKLAPKEIEPEPEEIVIESEDTDEEYAIVINNTDSEEESDK